MSEKITDMNEVLKTPTGQLLLEAILKKLEHIEQLVLARTTESYIRPYTYDGTIPKNQFQPLEPFDPNRTT